jgi:hypothetical protein
MIICTEDLWKDSIPLPGNTCPPTTVLPRQSSHDSSPTTVRNNQIGVHVLSGVIFHIHFIIVKLYIRLSTATI